MSSTVSSTATPRALPDGGARGRPHDAGDRCPGVLRPHAAADGLLVRVRLVGGRLGPAALRALADGARRGNGIVELTSRGNVQLRGVRPTELAPLADALTAAGLLRSPAHERVRNVLVDPLAGRRPGALADVDDVVDALDDGLCGDPALAALPGRFLFTVDDGSGALADVDADVRLRALGAGRWSVGVAGRSVVSADPVRVALAVAGAFLAAAPGAGTWRVADLPDGGRGLLDGAVADAVPDAVVAPTVGTLPQVDGRVAVGALAPLGRLPLSALTILAELAVRHPVRASHRRSVAVLDLAPADASAVRDRLVAAGLVTGTSSGWSGLTACAGLGACANARGDARAAAAARVRVRAAAADPPREHWVACERRCGDGPGVRTIVAEAVAA